MVKILDCTIRDGGHLNGWNFSDEIVRAAYYAAVKSGIDYFEVGYRFKQPKESFGKFAKCDDDYLAGVLRSNDNCKLTVMIDAGKSDTADFVECKKELTTIRAVRVATYPNELELALTQCEALSEKGYEVFINLMVISEYKDEQFEILKNWKNKNILEAVSFADSFGSFIPKDIEKYINKLKSLGFEKIGFHSHNNLQLAFANSLKAIECGAYMVDASIFGMGRESGNLPIEILTGYLEKTDEKKYNPVAYIDVIERYFAEENKKTPWGYRIQSLIGGLKNIHPYYVNGLYTKHLYSINEVWNAAELVKENCPIPFNEKKMDTLLSDKFINYDDIEIVNRIPFSPAEDAFEQRKPDFLNKHEGRNFLILANGSSIVEKREKLLEFIKEKNCVVIGTNFLNRHFVPDYHCFADRINFLKYADSVDSSSILLIPSFAGKDIVKQNTKNEAMYFDAELAECYEYPIFAGNSHKYLDLNAAISAICCAFQMGAKEIYAAGLDGLGQSASSFDYFFKDAENEKDKNMLIREYKIMSDDLERIDTYMQKRLVPFSIITPTSHTRYFQNSLREKESKF